VNSPHLLPERSLAIAALAADDPERLVAEAHARECPACRALLAEGADMLTLLDTAGVDMAETVSPALKARVRASLAETPRLARPPLVLWLLGLASLLIAWFERTDGGLSVHIGMHCLAYEQAFALAPWLLALALERRRVAPFRLATYAMTGALLGQLVLHARCPAPHSLAHQLAFHVTGVVLAAVLGEVLGRKLLAR
jgi:predicted anti-sigma-YlaC factor YlaD